MEQLILMRHAKAEPEQGYADRDRPLTSEGRAAADAAGARMAALGLKPDLAIVSTALRTRETWIKVSAAFPDLQAIHLDRLYMADPGVIWSEAMHAGARSCLVIAHNPGLHELVRLLLEQSFDSSASARALAERFPPGAFAAFDLEGDVLEAAGSRLLASRLD